MSHVELSDICKSYRVGSNTITALNGFSVAIEAGEFAVVLGPSGSGKTTFLNILGGLELPDQGQIKVGGQVVTGLNEKQLTQYRRDKVGFVFQFFNLLPTLSALENVLLTAEMGQQRKKRAPKEDNGGAARQYSPAEIMAKVGLGERMDHYPGQLSGGQQQRVAIARALAKHPALVLADEPTGSLDFTTGIEVLGVMRALNRETGQTFVLVTHNQAIARMADRVIHIGDGRVQAVERNPLPTEPAELHW
jgi:putative ABC transport system ATP-binding protein